MGTFKLTKKQLKEKSSRGEGILNSFEIPAFTSSTSSILMFDNFRQIKFGSGNYQDVISSSLAFINNENPSFQELGLETYLSSGRGGGTIFNNSRIYTGLVMAKHPTVPSKSGGVPGTITAANIYLPVSSSNSDSGGASNYGGEIGIFLCSTASLNSGNLLTGGINDYPFYFTGSIGNKTIYSDFQTVTEVDVLTFPLNSTAITALNTSNDITSINSDRINFAFIWGYDFNGVPPTETNNYLLARTGSELPNRPTSGISEYNQFVVPYIEFIYTPD